MRRLHPYSVLYGIIVVLALVFILWVTGRL